MFNKINKIYYYKKLLLLTDDIDEAMQYIQAYIANHFTVKPRKRLWWLLEKR